MKSPEGREIGEKPSVLTGEFSDIANPAAYIEVAEKGIGALKNLLGSVEN